ncbi:hypothetical protein LXA43DRAFT_1099530 [Ganoderma leucocontextum]|nr:hypothetical protein LXA43DRAFT_1099530 [Ganoderma leucocontextum]
MSMHNGQTEPARVVDSLPLKLPSPAHGSGRGDLVMSPCSDLDRVAPGVPYVPASGSGSQPAGQGNRMGTQGKHGGTSANGARPGSKTESLSPYMANLSVNEAASTHRGSIDMPVPVAPPLPTEQEKSVKEVLQPTLKAAEREFVRARRTLRIYDCALFALLVLCTLTFGMGLRTAITLERWAAIVTLFSGCFSSLTALYLNTARAHGEPEKTSGHAWEVKWFISDLRRFMVEHGHLASSAKLPETEAMLARFKKLKLFRRTLRSDACC